MSSSAAEARTQSTSAKPASPRSLSQGKSIVGPKLIAGIGAALTIAVVAAAVTLGEPSAPSTAPTQAVQTAYASPAAPAPAEVATAAPVAAAPAMFVAPPAAAPAPVPPQTQCSLVQRKFYIAGNGVVRVRDGDFVSSAVVLGPYPQEVLMDLPRPANGFSPPETIVVEGRASTVVMTSDLPGFQKVINHLRGASSFGVQWAPLKNC
jgi:hypothetical protein